jgi:hypothetical protein
MECVSANAQLKGAICLSYESDCYVIGRKSLPSGRWQVLHHLTAWSSVRQPEEHSGTAGPVCLATGATNKQSCNRNQWQMNLAVDGL